MILEIMNIVSLSSINNITLVVGFVGFVVILFFIARRIIVVIVTLLLLLLLLLPNLWFKVMSVNIFYFVFHFDNTSFYSCCSFQVPDHIFLVTTFVKCCCIYIFFSWQELIVAHWLHKCITSIRSVTWLGGKKAERRVDL